MKDIDPPVKKLEKELNTLQEWSLRRLLIDWLIL